MTDNTDNYVYAIMLLLPLAAVMVIVQQNPYQALVMRGILGAIAALVYAMLGGADVALTEALVGTMLAITLYAVAVRSSLVMRLGVLEGEGVKDSLQWQPLLDYLRAMLKRYQLRLELVPYADSAALRQGLADKAIHATCLRVERQVMGHGEKSEDGPIYPASSLSQPPYQISIRVPRLYEILTVELPPVMADISVYGGDRASPSKPPVLEEQL
ncbi:DUF4040 domain-containing protein [Leptolyngbya sp. CCNP1308]|uniref:DUF4040 domain-containing protein n=1 Tax=Leptolyngbya sp. CCNP1308 TaxID=3110255 RepID=UPI002B20DB42|nr:DUF4040 domain-containing protein [Leptolyngbya sp. CCNP1308]MEA5451649.1 DUF4040 domain-containing protein [Leptolyngbya sp. CCNP1308]